MHLIKRFGHVERREFLRVHSKHAGFFKPLRAGQTCTPASIAAVHPYLKDIVSPSSNTTSFHCMLKALSTLTESQSAFCKRYHLFHCSLLFAKRQAPVTTKPMAITTLAAFCLAEGVKLLKDFRKSFLFSILYSGLRLRILPAFSMCLYADPTFLQVDLFSSIFNLAKKPSAFLCALAVNIAQRAAITDAFEIGSFPQENPIHRTGYPVILHES